MKTSTLVLIGIVTAVVGMAPVALILSGSSPEVAQVQLELRNEREAEAHRQSVIEAEDAARVSEEEARKASNNAYLASVSGSRPTTVGTFLSRTWTFIKVLAGLIAVIGFICFSLAEGLKLPTKTNSDEYHPSIYSKQRTGFSHLNNLPTRVYFVELKKGSQRFLKVGMTAKHCPTRRFEDDVEEGKLDSVRVIDQIVLVNRTAARYVEKQVLDASKGSHMTPTVPFGGSVRECREMSAKDSIQRLMDAARDSAKNQGTFHKA